MTAAEHVPHGEASHAVWMVRGARGSPPMFDLNSDMKRRRSWDRQKEGEWDVLCSSTSLVIFCISLRLGFYLIIQTDLICVAEHKKHLISSINLTVSSDANCRGKPQN